MSQRQALTEYRGHRTQAEMAQRYGVTQQAWGKWERGESLPRARTMVEIERDSGILIQHLFFAQENNLKFCTEGEEAKTT